MIGLDSPLRLSRWSLTLLGTLLLSGCPKHQADPEVPDLVWPAPPEPTRIKSVDTIVTSEWSKPTRGLRRLVQAITGNSDAVGFKKPYDVTTDSRGRVLVSDTGHGQVLVFDKEGGRFQFLGDDGQGATVKPAGVTTDARGHIFVADLKQGVVLEYDANLAFVHSYGGGLLTRPVGVVVHPGTNELWVSDSKRHVLDVFEVGGGHLRTIGKRGTELGQFNFPTNMAVGPDGHIYLVDAMNFRVQVIDAEGTPLRFWGENCDTFGCLAKAKGVSVARDGRVFVVDAAFNLVQVFEPEGELLMFFGGYGNLPGRVVLPAGIHIDQDNQIFLVNQYGWRVNVYEYYGDTPPPNAADNALK